MRASANNKEFDVAMRKKPVAKAPVRKKTTAKKTSSKTVKKADKSYKTLRIARSQQSFLSFKITKQTIYWSILVAFIIVMQLWILNVQFDVVQVTDQLNQQLETSFK